LSAVREEFVIKSILNSELRTNYKSMQHRKLIQNWLLNCVLICLLNWKLICYLHF